MRLKKHKNQLQLVANQIKQTNNIEQTRTAQTNNVEKDHQTNIETEALGPRKVGRFLVLGKLKQNHIAEDLEELQENKVHLQEEKEYNELQCHMFSDMFNKVKSFRNHMGKSYYFCVKCSDYFFKESDLKKLKKKCNICDQCGKEKHNEICI